MRVNPEFLRRGDLKNKTKTGLRPEIRKGLNLYQMADSCLFNKGTFEKTKPICGRVKLAQSLI